MDIIAMSTSEALEETFFLSKDGCSVCMLMSEKQSSTFELVPLQARGDFMKIRF
ncbi:hypothetical protein M119_1702 [Bacteroides fragilis str. 3783N1-6]|uniref:Uncharacterized protein n=1 Tax=Bacteroides fragilis str. 3783N1-6 TaxID=1339310 RepID=A0AB73AJN0_BACFG|nr:hypothetical protein M119_1702 [Bacteroides fragilis str. 3783N1-6]